MKCVRFRNLQEEFSVLDRSGADGVDFLDFYAIFQFLGEKHRTGPYQSEFGGEVASAAGKGNGSRNTGKNIHDIPLVGIR